MAIQIGGETVIDNSKNVTVGTAASVTVGQSFIANGYAGIGTQSTTTRNAGVGTATGTLIYNTTTKQIEVWDGAEWVGGLKSPLEVTGGTKDTASRTDYVIHTFTGSETLTLANGPGGPYTFEYLLSAGGGGGGGGSPPAHEVGGGGAGGLVTSNSWDVSNGSYSVEVGSGGAKGTGGSGTDGSHGTVSRLDTIYASGGGGGGAARRSGRPGGSGGGGSGIGGGPGTGNQWSPDAPGFPGPAPGQGNNGGRNSNSPGSHGGGGGGAGGAGSNAGPGPGNGGPAVSSSITGSSVNYSGGGGGGNGGSSSPSPGGGQGGQGANGSTSPGQDGFGGTVIIAYPTSILQ